MGGSGEGSMSGGSSARKKGVVAFSSIEIIAIVSLLGSNCMHCIVKCTYEVGKILIANDLPRGEYENCSKMPDT